jgi:photosystem II stability/assembly factor-like uncharacterized protein
VSFLKKSVLFIFAIIFSIQILNAQTNWKLNRSKASGDLIAVFFTSVDNGWIAGDDGYLAVTNDGGKNWTKQGIGTTESINEIYFRNDDNGYLVAGKKMFITKDAGRSWREIKIYKPNDFRGLSPEFLSIRFADKKRGIVIGSLLNQQEKVVDSVVMRTEDGGESWQRIIVPSKKELFHLDFVGSSKCWIVGDDGLILASNNGGESFQTQKSGTVLDLYNVDFRDENEGYIVGSKGTILRTQNGGANWETIKTIYPMTFLRVDFADDKNGVIVGYEGMILRSTDKGKTWTKQNSDTKDNLYGLYFTKKYGWAVGANGVVIQYLR